jgi:hypothetical protein
MHSYKYTFAHISFTHNNMSVLWFGRAQTEDMLECTN